jgi:RHH-type transcriptional regulator, proline utilization regulon repressor / proline dehydrogenase / delta 1-pyrroline-5-carboxylate dehydrogenase
VNAANGFKNEALLELRDAAVRSSLSDALATLDRELPIAVPVLVGSETKEEPGFPSIDPSRSDRVVAVAASASESDVDRAVDAAQSASSEWGGRPPEARAEVLVGAAKLMRADRMRLAALAVRECAKPWPEADADVAEAIDFLEYYARQAVALSAVVLLQVPGERNAIDFAPRGVAAVIAPWNFPLAIPTGMIGAALATGNAVVFKPAEHSPACGLAVVDALRRAGVPEGAINLLPGGDEPARRLVRSPKVQTIAFTGSCAAGLEILRVANEVSSGQKHLKRVVAEMGGKNCVIVDSDADLDEAIPAVVKGAYAFAGQKCSATSRVLVHEEIADAFMDRLIGSVGALAVDAAERFGVDVPPVIDDDAVERIGRYVALGSSQGHLAASGGPVPGGGHYCPPVVLEDLPPTSRVLSEEIFGPVLTVERVATVDQACDRIDQLPYALTGGLFSRNPLTVAAVAKRSPVGNLYVNRETTGARVGRQPFGGNRLSGNGTKAGGPHYLLNFVDPRVVCENTVRHGLVVE